MKNEKSYSGFLFVHFNCDNAILMVLTSIIQYSFKSIIFFGVDPEIPFRLSYFIFRRDFFENLNLSLQKTAELITLILKRMSEKNFFC